jgi:hypothetical protein
MASFSDSFKVGDGDIGELFKNPGQHIRATLKRMAT